MARKGENIFKRKDGRWEARYAKGRDLSGKIRYGFCYGKSYREAKEKVTRAKLELFQSTPTKPKGNRRTFSSFCEEWLAFQKNAVRESTYVKYETVIRNHIHPKLGKCFPFAMDSTLIEAFKEKLLTADGLSPKTVKDIMVVLRSVTHYIEKQFPDQFPKLEFRYPKMERKETRVLTIKEQKQLTDYLLSDINACKFGILLALLTGMRLGEICALQWKNVSLQEQTIRVCVTMQRLRNTNPNAGTKTKLLVGSPKSDASWRVIPLSDDAAALCQAMAHFSSDAYILTGKPEPMEPRALQYRLKKYTRECGLDGVHFHTLRHSFATRCMEVGFDLKSLSEVLGHAKTSTTLDRYVHSSLDVKRINMAKLALAGI